MAACVKPGMRTFCTRCHNPSATVIIRNIDTSCRGPKGSEDSIECWNSSSTAEENPLSTMFHGADLNNQHDGISVGLVTAEIGAR